MNITEALKTELPLRRPNRMFTYNNPYYPYTTVRIVRGSWIDPIFLVAHVHFMIEDLIADDWEVKDETV